MSMMFWVKTLSTEKIEGVEAQATVVETPVIPELPKCSKCGKEFNEWQGERRNEVFVCDGCIKYKCVSCGKQYSKKSGAHEGFQCNNCKEKERLKNIRKNAVAEFTFGRAQLFEKLLKAISDIQEEALFEVKHDGIVARLMDPSRVAMVDYFISKRSFDEYHVFKEGVLQINLEEVIKHFKHISKQTSIKAFIDGKDQKFTITFVDSRERERKIPTLEVEGAEIPPTPKFPSFGAKVKVVSSKFWEDLEDIGNVTDHVSFEADWKTFVMKAGGDYTTGKNTYSRDQTDSIVVEIEGNGDNRSVYSLSYLKTLIRKDLSEIVVFEWSKDMPLKITHEKALEDSNIVAYLAPRIEVE